MSTETQTAPSAVAISTDDVPELLIEVTGRALKQSFDKMIGETEITVPEQESGEVEGVVGLISFVGDVTWSLALMFPQASAEKLAHKFAGFPIAYDSLDMGDVVGEMANVLAGVICGELENEGVKSFMSLPTVTRGQHVELLLGGHLIARRIIVNVADCEFAVRLIVSKSNFVPHVMY